MINLQLKDFQQQTVDFLLEKPQNNINNSNKLL